jgi:TatD DNase family protein
MLIDTHAHVNFNAYKDDADEVIRRTLAGGMNLINVGSQYKTSKRALDLAEKYNEGVFAAVGLHPIHLASGVFKTKVDKEEIEFQTNEEDFDCDKYRELAGSKKVVAIGETGLDYWYKPKTKTRLEQFKQKQKEVFIKQLSLAQELNLPLIIHCRSAHNDLLEILNAKSKILNTERRGVIHCFTGNWQEAQQYLEMGFYIGFNGIIFKLNLDDVIMRTPLERMLLETDCPYLTPPFEEGRNEPLYVRYAAEKIAQLKKITFDEIAEITTRNTKELFKV